MRLAAELWAKARQQGRPTSPALDLDMDVILGAQALALDVGAEVIVVTTNPRHLRQFVDARLWNDTRGFDVMGAIGGIPRQRTLEVE